MEDLTHVESVVNGSVKCLYVFAQATCSHREITPFIMTDHQIDCEARIACEELAQLIRKHAGTCPIASIEGGEPVVKLTRKGKCGMKQNLTLNSAKILADLKYRGVLIWLRRD